MSADKAKELGVKPRDFNQYGTRRGNHQGMMRGTFANIRIKNLMVKGVEGGVTVHYPSGERMAIYDAAMRYRDGGVPLVVFAGKEYGTGSSRDWAAKGTLLLGVKAVQVSLDGASRETFNRMRVLGEFNKAIVTVPAYFNDAQRQATKDAGRIAGLEGSDDGVAPADGHAAVEEERVEPDLLGRGEGAGGSVGDLVRLADDEILEPVARLERHRIEAGLRLDRLLGDLSDLPDGSVDVVSRTGYRRRLPLREGAASGSLHPRLPARSRSRGPNRRQSGARASCWWSRLRAASWSRRSCRPSAKFRRIPVRRALHRGRGTRASAERVPARRRQGQGDP